MRKFRYVFAAKNHSFELKPEEIEVESDIV